jgi:hypothetical protein
MKSYPSTRCLLFGAPTPYFRAVSNKTKQIKGADQRPNVRAEEPGPIRDEKSDQISSEGPRNNTEVKTQSA